MKTKFIFLSLALLIFLSCNNDSKEASTKQTCEEKLNEAYSWDDTLFPLPDDLDDQQIMTVAKYRTISGEFHIKKNRHLPSGDIDFNNNTIKMIIPVTDNSLKIVNYLSISRPHISALLIVLDNKTAITTPDTTPTHVIKKTFDISKTGLKIKSLIQHNRLSVFVLHTNDFHIGKIVEYLKCIDSLPGYNHSCFRIQFPISPNDNDGDIIP